MSAGRNKVKAKVVHLTDSKIPGRAFHTACGRDMAHVKHETADPKLATCPLCLKIGQVAR